MLIDFGVIVIGQIQFDSEAAFSAFCVVFC